MFNHRYQYGPSGQTGVPGFHSQGTFTNNGKSFDNNQVTGNNILPQHIISTKNGTSTYCIDTSDSLNLQNGKHYKEKLSCIREDLKAFEQQTNYSITNHTPYQNPVKNIQFPGYSRSSTTNQRPSPPSSSSSATTTTNYGDSNNSRDTQKSMINYLTSMGYNEVDAICALNLVKYSSVTAAANLLISIEKNKGNEDINNGVYNNNIHTSIINVPSNGKVYLPPPLPPLSSVQSQQSGNNITLSAPPSAAAATTTPSQLPLPASSSSSTTTATTTSTSTTAYPVNSIEENGNCDGSYQEYNKRIPLYCQYQNNYYYNECLDKQTSQRTGTVISIEQGSSNNLSLSNYKSPINSNDIRKVHSSRIPTTPDQQHQKNATYNNIEVKRSDSYKIPTTNNTRNINLIKMHQQSSFGNGSTNLPKQQSLTTSSSSTTTTTTTTSTTTSSSGNFNRNSPSLHNNIVNNNRGIQSIIVNPDVTPDLEKELDKICKVVTRLPLINSTSLDIPLTSSPSDDNNYYNKEERRKSSGNFERNIGKRKVIRSLSPLPESVNNRLKNNIFESNIRHCKAGMFRFFMEQHIEKLIQQYKERNQRAIQLMSEMEQADLPERLKKQLLKFLHQKESKYIRLKRQRMNVGMFDILKHIGVGAFGKVSLVKKKDTGQVYAMKTLVKTEVIQKQQAAHVKAERDILAEANSPWIVKLFFSFQDSCNLYFIMEYVPGGDMMQLLINKGIFNESLARFYIAELTCAIEYVHSLGFIHRDIKPDNILIDKLGHIKLTDFGLCTGLRWTHDKRHYVIAENGEIPEHMRSDSFNLSNGGNWKEPIKVLEQRYANKRNQAHSVVGTSNYMAPEVILKIGHTKACDWWSVGVILYEMVLGRPPFMSQTEDPRETQYKIVNWKHYLNLVDHTGKLSKECLNMIKNLCRDQESRLGKNGANEIKKDSWFNGIDFNTLRSRKAEWIPKVDHAEDTSNFDDIKFEDDIFGGDLPPQFVNNPAFYEFTYRHFFDLEGQGPMSGGRIYHSHKRAPLSNIEGMSTIMTIHENSNNDKGSFNNTKESQKISSNFTRTTTSFSPGKESPIANNIIGGLGTENQGKIITNINNSFQNPKMLNGGLLTCNVSGNGGSRLNGFHLLKHHQKYKLSSAIRTPSMGRKGERIEGRKNEVIKEDDSYESDPSEMKV
ncbi:Protein kinase domain and AGC-kinase, C-terminal domain and Serine/threonine-/dual specificity protein kinase, catalytic domain and UBA-like domain and Protein kinase-like domain-containing protein [Strongyloides ratti]|uniref:non-specific serine/threonine protein kinase n=1 Tax=Strongyloides ratti TaxID=34506 RepID=A0A090LF02_STRRB|nr:Protein kinase domain and AGC-kinase, C-terminal domain and Serine/threonine-/dual specificity protein kinase, catalytic domain and UBA-like domain and Protein kinase-like domain-containing protein [Strongyloides ratti]CEF66693.1 Protein kinase domain and AGC-kinase, C-terminal domain and Serine/threonine-/dual specificity protein kinase, catalytic domain and UBA-like domain and Protein kinase-like domain-containing protein [Strongyloides ratti]